MTVQVSLCTGVLPAAGRGHQGAGVRHAPVQHRWGGGHVGAGRAARGRNHAQPVPALPEGPHLCKCISTTSCLLVLACLKPNGHLFGSYEGAFVWKRGDALLVL